VDLSAAEARVLGCLIEKQRTTPDTYPLSLNALRLACNQSTNRDPVVDYDEPTVRDAVQRLARRRLARLASGHTTRAVKYRHLADEALGLGPAALAVLCVLLLRGAQTPGELKGRTERMQRFASLEEVDAVLEELIERGYAERRPRRPGQKEERYAHLLGEEEEASAGSAPAPAPAAPVRPAEPPAAAERPPAVRAAPGDGDLARRVDRLEHEVADLRGELEAQRAALAEQRAALGALREELGA
jgi:uncharacterized protein